jgi:hypothetical protein
MGCLRHSVTPFWGESPGASGHRAGADLCVMPMRPGLASKFKAEPAQRATDFLSRKVARKLHADIGSTGSFTKCNRIGHCRCGSSISKRQLTRSRIVGANASTLTAPSAGDVLRGKRGIPTQSMTAPRRIAAGCASRCSTAARRPPG